MEHELIETLEKVDDDWMKGRIGEREGMFPISFVKVISDIPIVLSEAPKKKKAASQETKKAPPSGMCLRVCYGGRVSTL